MKKQGIKTTRDLGNAILDIVKNESRMYPYDLLDYAAVTSDIVHIVDSEFDLKADLHYGSVEGIYLSMSIEGYFSNDPYHEVKEFVMVFKTLRTDDDAMYKMVTLQASCMIACKKHLEEHASDYERRGYRCTKAGATSIHCETQNRALYYLAQGYNVTDLRTLKALNAENRGENENE